MGNCLFENEQHKNVAVNEVQTTNKCYVSSSNLCTVITKTTTSIPMRIKQCTSQKHKHDKFGGKIGEDIKELFSNYETAANEYKLSDILKLLYLCT